MRYVRDGADEQRRTSLWIFVWWISDFQDFQRSFRCLCSGANDQMNK